MRNGTTLGILEVFPHNIVRLELHNCCDLPNESRDVGGAEWGHVILSMNLFVPTHLTLRRGISDTERRINSNFAAITRVL